MNIQKKVDCLLSTPFGVELTTEARLRRAEALMKADAIMEITSPEQSQAAEAAIEGLRLILDEIEDARRTITAKIDATAWRAKEPVADEIGRLAALRQAHEFKLITNEPDGVANRMDAYWQSQKEAEAKARQQC